MNHSYFFNPYSKKAALFSRRIFFCVTFVAALLLLSSFEYAYTQSTLPKETRPYLELPFPGETTYEVTCGYGCYQHQNSMSYAVDFAVPEGDPILAAAAGTVKDVTWERGLPAHLDLGDALILYLDHGDGWFTRYVHLDGITVEVGEQVEMGDIIGYGGKTGASGAHLHFELKYGISLHSASVPINELFDGKVPEAGKRYVSNNWTLANKALATQSLAEAQEIVQAERNPDLKSVAEATDTLPVEEESVAQETVDREEEEEAVEEIALEPALDREEEEEAVEEIALEPALDREEEAVEEVVLEPTFDTEEEEQGEGETVEEIALELTLDIEEEAVEEVPLEPTFDREEEAVEEIALEPTFDTEEQGKEEAVEEVPLESTLDIEEEAVEEVPLESTLDIQEEAVEEVVLEASQESKEVLEEVEVGASEEGEETAKEKVDIKSSEAAQPTEDEASEEAQVLALDSPAPIAEQEPQMPYIETELSLSAPSISVLTPMTATFTLRNGSSERLHLATLGVVARRKGETSALNRSLFFERSIVLNPGRSYDFQQQHTLKQMGDFELFIFAFDANNKLISLQGAEQIVPLQVERLANTIYLPLVKGSE